MSEKNNILNIDENGLCHVCAKEKEFRAKLLERHASILRGCRKEYERIQFLKDKDMQECIRKKKTVEKCQDCINLQLFWQNNNRYPPKHIPDSRYESKISIESF